MNYGNKRAYVPQGQRQAYQGAPYANQPAYAPYHNQPQPKKHSGAKTKRYTPEKGDNAGIEMTHTHGWMYRRREGLTTFSCNTTKKTVLKERTGWMGSIACEVISGNKQKSFYWGTMEYSTGKVVIDSLGLVISPKGGQGGYTGSFGKPKR